MFVNILAPFWTLVVFLPFCFFFYFLFFLPPLKDLKLPAKCLLTMLGRSAQTGRRPITKGSLKCLLANALVFSVFFLFPISGLLPA